MADFKTVVELSVVVPAVQYPLRVTMASENEVRVSDIDQQNEYYNDGFSEVVSFTYGTPCVVPTDLAVSKYAAKIAKLRWTPTKDIKQYEFAYKLQDTPDNRILDQSSINKWQTQTSYAYEAYATLKYNVELYEFKVRSLCSNARTSEWSEAVTLPADKTFPKSEDPKARTTTPLNTEPPSPTSTTPIDKVLNPFDIPVSSEDIDEAAIKKRISEITDLSLTDNTQRCGYAISRNLDCDLTPLPNADTGIDFANPKGKYVYINGYEILVTRDAGAGSHTGEGLLYYPYLKTRIPVAWSGASIKKATDGDYGCLSPEVIAIGSQNGVVAADYRQQVIDLLTSGPHAFSGNLKEALAELKKIVADINAGKTIDPAYAKNVIDAAQKGIEEWKATVSKYFTDGTAPLPPEVQQILNSIEAIKTTLNAPKDCLAQNIPTTTSPSGRNNIIRLFPIDACTLSAEQKSVLEGALAGLESNVELVANLLKPLPNETYGKREFTCRNGKKISLVFDAGIDIAVNDLDKPPTWTINGTAYVCYWNNAETEIFGFYKKTEVATLPKVTATSLYTLTKFGGVRQVGSVEANSPDCKKKAGDFDPTTQGDYFTDAGLNRLKDKLAQQGASNTEITVKDCTDPTKAPKTVTKGSINAPPKQKSIQIEMCWDGTKWKSTITQYSYSSSNAQAKGMTNIAEAGQAAKDAAKNALDNNTGIEAFSKNSSDGVHQFTVGSADALESAVYFLETGKYLIENLQVPPESWQGGGPSKKVLSIPPVLGGGTDQGLAEVKDLKQMVDLGVAFVKEPASTLTGIWDGITGMTWEDAASVAFGDWADRYKNYEKGNPYDWYQGGKDGVSVVKYFSAGGIFTITGGIKEMPAELKKKFDNISDLWRGIAKNADDLLATKVTRVKSLASDVQVGYRGSLANGVKYNKKYVDGGDAPEFLPFNPESWDVDAFIVSDELAANPVFSRGGFRDGKLLPDLNPICTELETAFRGVNGYRTGPGKEFTYAIWTKAEFERKVKPYGYKLF